jgi:hypothetical protein
MPHTPNKPAQLADGIPPLPTLADRNARLEALTLQNGDIVAHESEPDLCGYVCGRTETGAYIVDYSISMPPTEAEAGELIVIKKFDKPPPAIKRRSPGGTDGYIRTLHKI